MKQFLIILITIFSFGFGLPKKIQKKVDKVIQSTFDVEDYTFETYAISSEITKDLPSKFGSDNFFKIQSSQNIIGYAYISRAPSKTAEYDYLILLDSDFVVVKAKILIYREEYGGEISSKRWLKQFIGKTKDDTFKYGDNIDAIAGATISVRSMTNAMNDFMASLKILKQKKLL